MRSDNITWAEEAVSLLTVSSVSSCHIWDWRKKHMFWVCVKKFEYAVNPLLSTFARQSARGAESSQG